MEENPKFPTVQYNIPWSNGLSVPTREPVKAVNVNARLLAAGMARDSGTR